jgi:hypothetical protein
VEETLHPKATIGNSSRVLTISDGAGRQRYTAMQSGFVLQSEYIYNVMSAEGLKQLWEDVGFDPTSISIRKYRALSN